MMRFLCSILPVLAVLFSTSLTCASQSESRGSVAALLGYGVTAQNNDNLLGPGLGLRAGYTCACRLYAGALAAFHLGSRDAWEPKARHRAQSLRGELGYEFWYSRLTLRPSLRAGAAWVRTARDVDGHFVSPDLGLGVTLLVPINCWFVGFDADARYLSRLVRNGDNLYVNATLGGYLTAGLDF